jgi:hypothetical protein
MVVIDELKIIQIAYKESGALFLFLSSIQVLGKVFPHVSQVVKAGQFVDVGEGLEFFLAKLCAHALLDKFIS